MNVLQLSRISMYPPQNGAEMRVWKTAEKLHELGDLWVAAPFGATELPEGIERVDLSTPLFSRRAVRNQLWLGLFLLAERHPLRRLLTDAVVDAVSSTDVTFDVVVCEFPQVTDAAFEVAAEHDARVLLNKHNAAYEILESFLRERSMPAFLGDRATRNLYSFEQRSIAAADVTVFQSEDDEAQFDTGADTETFVIPNGCDFEWIEDGGDPDAVARQCGVSPDAFTCVFLGSYDYAPNRRAASLIDEEIAPALPDVTFLLVGRNPPATTADNVVAPGYLDDLPGALSLADVALCPLFSGSGTKLKMLDYFAAGLPVVTTSVGVQGLDVADEREVLLAETAAEMVESIGRLRSSDSLRRRLAGAGSEIAADHSWDALMAEYEAVFESLGID